MKSKNEIQLRPLHELEFEVSALKDRIKRLEADIRSPLEADFSEQAQQLSNRLLHTRLLQVERETLAQLQKEISRRVQMA